MSFGRHEPISRASRISYAIRSISAELIPLNLLAVAAVGLALVGLDIGALVAVLAVLIIQSPIAVIRIPTERAIWYPTGANTVPRALVGVALAAVGAGDPLTLLAGLLLAAAAALESVLGRGYRHVMPFAAGLPGLSTRETARLHPRSSYWVSTAALALTAMLGFLPDRVVVTTSWATVAAANVIYVAVCFIDASALVIPRRAAERHLRRTIAAYAPRFLVHWDAPPGTAYQLTMWLPHLDQLGERYVIVARDPQSYAEVVGAISAPMVFRREAVGLEEVVVPSVQVAFYVNNAMKNTQLVRYPGIRHVQLNHGDSEKAPSFNPLFRMYDLDFVAGRAAIDRFTRNGVAVPSELFRIVGRPQSVGVVRARSGTKVETVLYAPTWAGHHGDSANSSMPHAMEIVTGLLDEGLTVLYRPHPYTDRDPGHRAVSLQVRQLLAADSRASGRRHVGDGAAEQAPLTEVFNRSDALVSDLSSVISDYLVSEKPMLLARPADAEELPLFRAAYVFDGALPGDFASALSRLLHGDPLRSERRAAAEYYLDGLDGDAASERFLREARALFDD